MKNLAFTAGDIRDFAFPEKSFDFVIHAAATVTVPGLASDEEYTTVFDGTRQVLQMCKSKKIKRLLYISSGAVYGVQPPEMAGVSEIFPCNPVNEYGRGKRDAENLCLGSGIDTVIARCFAFVGPHLPLDKHFAIGNFINNVLKGEDIYIKGDGTPYRSYMYASDLVEWLLTILLKGKSGEAYNVGSGKEISIRELAEKVASFSGGKSKVVIARKPENGVLPSRYVPDVNKAVTQLNLRCKVPLETAISETIKWNKAGEGK
jgi:dTDP-glucose 4,6-dehydratase